MHHQPDSVRDTGACSRICLYRSNWLSRESSSYGSYVMLALVAVSVIGQLLALPGGYRSELAFHRRAGCSACLGQGPGRLLLCIVAYQFVKDSVDAGARGSGVDGCSDHARDPVRHVAWEG